VVEVEVVRMVMLRRLLVVLVVVAEVLILLQQVSLILMVLLGLVAGKCWKLGLPLLMDFFLWFLLHPFLFSHFFF
jgi:hypothetical protein